MDSTKVKTSLSRLGKSGRDTSAPESRCRRSNLSPSLLRETAGQNALQSGDNAASTDTDVDARKSRVSPNGRGKSKPFRVWLASRDSTPLLTSRSHPRSICSSTGLKTGHISRRASIGHWQPTAEKGNIFAVCQMRSNTDLHPVSVRERNLTR